MKNRYLRNEKGQFVKGFSHNKGIIRSEEFKEMRRNIQKGKKPSDKTKKKMSATAKRIGSGKRLSHGRGERAANWRGGLTLLKDTIRRCFEYRQWRSDIYTRDNFICVLCGEKGGRIEADHYPESFLNILQKNKIKNFEEAIKCEELWNINNGRTLCKNCHRKTKSYGGKKKNDNM